MKNLNFITKIEGHGTLNIDWKRNKVRLEIHEGERLFEGMVVGRNLHDLYWITPRICGVCPIAHNLAAIKAVEHVLNLKPTEATLTLRKILLDAQIIQSHVLHLYFLAAPDYLGIDSGLEIKAAHPKYFAEALDLKRVADLIADTVGGRGIHPTATTAGGFHKIPTVEKLKELKKEAGKLIQAAEGTVNLFSSFKYPKISADLILFSTTNSKPYDVYDPTKIKSSKGLDADISNYKKIISEEVKSYSTAKFARYEGKGMMVGSLARLAFESNNLSAEAKKIYKKTEIDFKNPFHNNLAQAIEVFHFAQEINELLNKLIDEGIDDAIVNCDYKISQTSRGIGAVEAPRGSLYYEIEVDSKGLITYCNIITPTVQNLTSLEDSAQSLLGQTKGEDRNTREHLMEMLVRAYDPCITCSVH